MDPATHRRMRTAHANHSHECDCGKIVYGNGGHASHQWACRVAQTAMHRRAIERGREPDRWKHRPARCDICASSGSEGS